MQTYEISQEEKEINFKDLFVPLTDKKIVCFIIIIGFIVFMNMLFNNFVWDDKTYIIQNTAMQNLNIFAFFGRNMFNSIGQYRPIPAIYFAELHALFKDNQFFYHFVQLLLHIVNTILVFKLFTKFFNRGSSFIVSLIFLVHPLQVESVSFISAAISPIFFFFGISALLLSLKETQTKTEVFLSFFLLLLSLFTKETGILFLLMILVYRSVFYKNSLVLYLCYGFVTCCVYLVSRFLVGHVGFYRLILIPIARLSLPERLINMPAIVYYYISNLFLPINLAHNQLWVVTKINFNNGIVPLIVDLLFFLCIAFVGFQIFIKSKQHFKIYIFFLFWFVLGLGMHLQIIPLDETVADRWVYFPLVGLLGIVASITLTYKLFLQKYHYVSLMIVIGIIMAFSIRTIIRNTNWVNGITLYTHDMKISDNFDIEDNSGVEYFAQGNFEQAKKHFEDSYNLFPYEVNAYNLALTYVQMKNYVMADVYYNKSLQEKDYAETTHQHELGNYQMYIHLLLQRKQYNKALVITKKGIEDYPNVSDLWMSLAFLNYKKGNKQEALTDSKKALSLGQHNQTAFALYNTILYSEPIFIKALK